MLLSRAQALDNVDLKIKMVVIETILNCNAQCVMCVHSVKKMTGLMPMELFEKLAHDAAESGIEDVCMSFYGEPFVDKKFVERVQILRSLGLRYGFFTNASMMTSDKIGSLFSLGGWDYVNFSVNGFSAEVYEKMMPPLNRDHTYANIDTLLKMKNKLQTSKPNVTISCVKTKENENEITQFLRYWKSQKGVDNVIIADCGDWLGNMDTSAMAVETRGVRRGEWLAPCPDLWGRGLYVYFDGRVTPCCEDAGSRNLIVGDANTETLSEIFNGENMTKLRSIHKSGNRKSHAVCGRCTWNKPFIV